MKLKKEKKSKVMRGKGMGTHGWGARKKRMGSGHRGGFGMAGTGKKADHKKSLVIKKYKKYFGKAGFTSRPTERRKNKVMYLDYISKNLVSLSKYKILGKGELDNGFDIKELRAIGASKSAKEKLEKSGCKVNIIEIATVKQYIKKEKKVDDKVKKEQKKEVKEKKSEDTEAEKVENQEA